MNYKALMSSLAAITGIALAIIGLSINHLHQQEKVAAADSLPLTTPLSGISAVAMVPAPIASSDKSVSAGGRCNIERIDGDLFNESMSHTRMLPIELSGWVVDPGTKSVPTDVGVRIEQSTKQQAWIVPLTVSINRPDVLLTQGNGRVNLRSGFSVRINPAGLPNGDYHVLIQYRSGGSTHVCDNGRKLQIDG